MNGTFKKSKIIKNNVDKISREMNGGQKKCKQSFEF